MRFEVAERYQIIEQTERGTGKLELLLLKKQNRRRPTYRLAVAYKSQGQIKIRYVRWYNDNNFSFEWTSDPSKACWWTEGQARTVVNTILKMSSMFYGTFDWADVGHLGYY